MDPAAGFPNDDPPNALFVLFVFVFVFVFVLVRVVSSASARLLEVPKAPKDDAAPPLLLLLLPLPMPGLLFIPVPLLIVLELVLLAKGDGAPKLEVEEAFAPKPPN